MVEVSGLPLPNVLCFTLRGKGSIWMNKRAASVGGESTKGRFSLRKRDSHNQGHWAEDPLRYHDHNSASRRAQRLAQGSNWALGNGGPPDRWCWQPSLVLQKRGCSLQRKGAMEEALIALHSLSPWTARTEPSLPSACSL